MTIQYSVAIRNARLDAVESTAGASAKLYIYSGAKPADCAAADPAGLLVTINLPADWLAAAAAGSKALLGSWTAAATAAGVAASFRIKETTGTTTHIQGTVTATGGGGDMTLNNTNIANSQNVTVDTFTLTAGNS